MFRFSIRDLLWLTLVVAMGLGWFVRERVLLNNLQEAKKELVRWKGIAEERFTVQQLETIQELLQVMKEHAHDERP